LILPREDVKFKGRRRGEGGRRKAGGGGEEERRRRDCWRRRIRRKRQTEAGDGGMLCVPMLVTEKNPWRNVISRQKFFIGKDATYLLGSNNIITEVSG
jgi:hypothetical protein